MKRIMLLAAFAVVLSSLDASAQGKAGTVQPQAGNLDRTNSRSQPGTWQNSSGKDMRETPGANTKEQRQVVAGSSVTSTVQQDTTRRRRDTVRAPEPIPTPPPPPAPPMPRDTPRTK